MEPSSGHGWDWGRLDRAILQPRLLLRLRKNKCMEQEGDGNQHG